MKAHANLSFAWIIVLLLFNFSALQTIRSQEYLKVHEVYDFDPGDEYHYTHDYYEKVHSTNQTIYYVEDLINITIFQKFYSADEDTVFYVRNVTKFNYLNNQITEVSDTVYFTNLNENASPIGLIYIKFLPDYCNGREMNEYSTGDSFGAKLRIFVRGCGNTRNSSGNSGGGSSIHSDYKLLYYRKGEETWGNPVFVSIESQKIPKEALRLYPNPASNIVYFDFAGLTEFDCYLYNQEGQMLMQLRVDSQRNWMDISGLQPGMYCIKVNHENYSSTTKLIRM